MSEGGTGRDPGGPNEPEESETNNAQGVPPWPRAEEQTEAAEPSIPAWVNRFLWIVMILALSLFVLACILIVGELALRN